MRVAHIYRARVHEILEDQPELPVWPPYADGKIPILVDITGMDNVVLNDGWNLDTNTVVKLPNVETRPGFYTIYDWNETTYEYEVSYREVVIPDPVTPVIPEQNASQETNGDSEVQKVATTDVYGNVICPYCNSGSSVIPVDGKNICTHCRKSF